MRCVAYCTAEAYDLAALRQKFEILNDSVEVFRDGLGVSFKEGRFAFYFSFGVIVLWGYSIDEEKKQLQKLSVFEIQPVRPFEVDEFSYHLGEGMKILKDEITLPMNEPRAMLAVSHAIAQSVKLALFETAVAKAVEQSKGIALELSQKGHVTLSRKEISKKMGQLFLERAHINAHFDVLDTPEIFWEFSELEPYYKVIANYLDLSSRVLVLNRRLDILKEMFDVLGSELNNQYSSKLEWVIIILIMIEVVITLSHDVLKMF